MALYTVTVVSETKKLCAGYTVKSSVMELRRIENAEVFFVQQITQKEGITSENNLLFGIKQEFQNAMKENLSKIKQERMDLHLKLAEFARMFLTFYENQLTHS